MGQRRLGINPQPSEKETKKGKSKKPNKQTTPDPKVRNVKCIVPKSRVAFEYKEWQLKGWIIPRVSSSLIFVLWSLMTVIQWTVSVHTHAVVFALLYHIWLVLGKSSSHPRLSSCCHIPPLRGRTFLRCENCGCWCFSLPSCCGASGHFYLPSYRYALRRNLAILETHLSVLYPVERPKQATF